ncbi:MAG: amidohydrolase [Armatimonadota bacterium]
MRLDAHAHLWRYHADQYPWIGVHMAALRRDFTPDDWLCAAGPLGFEGLIAVQARQSLEETQWLLELSDRHPMIRGVVGWVDLRGPSLDEQLELLCDHPRFVGVRHVLQDDGEPGFMLRNDFLRGIARLGQHHLAYDILVRAEQLPLAAQMVAHFPRQRFVLNHMGKPDIRAGRMEPWASDLRRLAQHEHMWCKVSSLTTMADWEAWTPEQLTPWLEVVLDAFGPQRLMIGSDWPVCLVAGDYARVMAPVLAWASELPGDAQSAVLGGNCARAYGVGSG